VAIFFKKKWIQWWPTNWYPCVVRSYERDRSSSPCSMSIDTYDVFQNARRYNLPTSVIQILVALNTAVRHWCGFILKSVYVLRDEILNKAGTFYLLYVSFPVFYRWALPSLWIATRACKLCILLVPQPLSILDSFQSMRSLFFHFIEDHFF
jgi:hypothetical protein